MLSERVFPIGICLFSRVITDELRLNRLNTIPTMKYWLITTEFPPFHGGGISTYAYHTAKMLKQKGHDVLVINSDYNQKPNIKEIELFEDIPVLRFYPSSSVDGVVGYSSNLSMGIYELVKQLIEEHGDPDYVEVQDYHGIGYYLQQYKLINADFLKNTPLVVTAHAPSYYYQEFNQDSLYQFPFFWIGEQERFSIKAADATFYPSQFLKDELELDSIVSEVVRNPFHMEGYNWEDVSFDSDEVVFFGKLTYQKGILQLIKLMSTMWDEGSDIKLSVIGADHYFEPRKSNMKEFLEKKYERYISKGLIKFEGKLNFEKLKARLLHAKVIVVPSVTDNFPYTVVEALSMGKVLMVSQSGGQAEMIDDYKTGFVFDLYDDNSFAKRLKYIYDCTDEELHQIGKNARIKINKMCSYNAVYEHKMRLLNKISNKYKERKDFPVIRHIEKKQPKLSADLKPSFLSIVIPYFNAEAYIDETLDSALATDYSNREIIIVNDGSNKDASLMKLEEIKRKHPEVKIVNKRNGGLATARNFGAQEAKGEFIAFLDADDNIHTNFYSRAIDLLKRYNNISFVHSWVQYFQDSNSIWPSFSPEPPYFLIHNTVNAGGLIRTIDFINFGQNDAIMEYGMEDYESYVSLVAGGCKGIVIPEPMYYYRIHSSSMARGFNKTNMLYLYKLISYKHRDLFDKFSSEIFNLLNANGPGYLYDNPTFEHGTDVIVLREQIKKLEEHNQSIKQLHSNQKVKIDAVSNNMFEHQLDYEANRADEIQEWYNKEYEVLPTWFKRFGHVIKYLSGNRKSLN